VPDLQTAEEIAHGKPRRKLSKERCFSALFTHLLMLVLCYEHAVTSPDSFRQTNGTTTMQMTDVSAYSIETISHLAGNACGPPSPSSTRVITDYDLSHKAAHPSTPSLTPQNRRRRAIVIVQQCLCHAGNFQHLACLSCHTLPNTKRVVFLASIREG
jgi:hypothetical protein